jgi:hypothetical protein
MAKIQRHLSIHFNIRFFKGITHEEILSEVEKKGRIRQCWFCAVHRNRLYNFSEGFEYEGKINIRWNNTKKNPG